MADIEAIFYQIRVPDHDSSFLHFLWWDDGNMAREVQDYQMLVHLFGAISSPVCANSPFDELQKTTRVTSPLK